MSEHELDACADVELTWDAAIPGPGPIYRISFAAGVLGVAIIAWLAVGALTGLWGAE